MGTQTMTSTHEMTTYSDWGKVENDANGSVTVKRMTSTTGQVLVAMGTKEGAYMKMSFNDAIAFANAKLEAAQDGHAVEDRYCFSHEEDREHEWNHHEMVPMTEQEKWAHEAEIAADAALDRHMQMTEDRHFEIIGGDLDPQEPEWY